MLKRWKIFCAAAIFVLMTALKLLMPDSAAAVRMQVASALNYDVDYVEALNLLADKLSFSESERSEPQSAVLMMEKSAGSVATQPFYLRRYTEEAVSEGEGIPQLPAAVKVFLESQAAFADYELPETVDYNFRMLPFSYTVPVSGYNSSGFGYRLHPILNIVRFHYGTDFAANTGEQVLAFADGTVSFAGYDESFGNHLMIDHGDGWQSHYSHCSVLNVAQGVQVSGGECVALVGATGLATGPHLHFELTKNGIYINPEYYINQ